MALPTLGRVAAHRLAQTAVVFTLFATLCVGFPHALVSIALLLAFLCALVAKAGGGLSQKRRFAEARQPIAPLRWAMWAGTLFGAVVLLRFGVAALSGDALSWSGLGHAIAPLALLWFAREVAPWVQKHAVSAMWVGFGVIVVLYTLVFSVSLPHWRVLSPYQIYVGNDAIWLGIALAIGAAGASLTALVIFWRGDADERMRAGRWAAGGLVLVLALVTFAQSRSALLIFGIALTAGSVFAGRRWWHRLLAPVALTALVAVAFTASPVARERISTASKEVVNALALYKVDSSQGQRLALASVSVRVWKDAFWFGHGLGMWRKEFVARVPAQWNAAIGHHSSPHNEYLNILGQLGLVGLVAYAGMLASVVIAGARVLVVQGSPWIFVTGVAWSLGSLTNVFLWDFRFFAPFSALFVCAWALGTLHDENSR